MSVGLGEADSIPVAVGTWPKFQGVGMGCL